MRLITSLSALALAATLGASAAQAQEMKPEERSILRSEVRKYLLENPEVIMEALQILEQKRQLAEVEGDIRLVEEHADEIFNDGYSFVGGNPEGDITVVEFVDYNCGYCKRAHNEVKTLLGLDPDLRFVVKEFPILGPTSRRAAVAALAALEQGDDAKYVAYNDALMTHQGRLEDSHVYAAADRVGLDVERLRADMERDDIRAKVERTYELARALRIEGTPAFIIGDTIVRGYIPLAQLQETVALARRAVN